MMVAWGSFPRSDFAIVKGPLTEFASSTSVTRGCCAACGTSLTYRHNGRPKEIDVTLASMDDPAHLKPECHLWVRDKLHWMAIDDGLPQFEAGASN